MNIILQNKSTHQYVGQDGWTIDPKEAYPFRTSASALAHCSQKKLQGMDCIYSFSDARRNIVMPIDSMTSEGR